ncbi:VWFA domain-containing protein [Vibrio chagasii]|nr:VWFA domain-containing protein [Vibrio chagasii]
MKNATAEKPTASKMSPAMLMRRQRALIRKFTLLQAMNTGRAGVVQIQGTKAGTTGHSTVLPLGNMEDPEYLDMLEGMMDHENGHCKHTDFSVWYSIRNKLVQQLTNIFEDVRIEKLVAREYPGAKINLLKLVQVAIKRGLFSQPSMEDDLVQLVQKYILYFGRYQHLNQYHLRDYALEAQSCLRLALPNAFPKIEAIVAASESASSTADALHYAEEVLKVLRDEQQEQEQQEQQNQEGGEGSDSDENQEQGEQDQSSSSNNSQSDNNDQNDEKEQGEDNSETDDSSNDDQSGDQNDKSDENEDGQSGGSDDSNDDEEEDDQSGGSGSESDDNEEGDQSGGSDSESDDNEDGDQSGGSDSESDDNEDGDQSGSSDSESNGDEKGDQSESSDSNSDSNSDDSTDGEDYSQQVSSEEIDKAINAEEEDLMEDMHDAIRRMMEDKAEENVKDFQEEHGDSYATPTMAFSCRKSPCTQGMPPWMPQARQLSQRVKTVLHSILYDRNRVKRHYDNTGSDICPGTLWGVSAGNSRVFQTETISKSPNTAFSILVDRSGSMQGSEMEMANVSAFAIAQALEFIKGAECEVMYYPFGDHYSNGYNHVAKSFTERMSTVANRSFNVDADNGTPTAEALQGATASLGLRKEPRKVLFLITDGRTSGATVQAALRECDVMGITVIGVGIGTGELAGFEHRPCFAINSANELSTALFNYLKTHYRG